MSNVKTTRPKYPTTLSSVTYKQTLISTTIEFTIDYVCYAWIQRLVIFNSLHILILFCIGYSICFHSFACISSILTMSFIILFDYQKYGKTAILFDIMFSSHLIYSYGYVMLCYMLCYNRYIYRVIT